MIIRKLDELGRIVIPKEMRKDLGLNEHDPVEIEVEGRQIIIHKHEGRCAFCGSDKKLIEFKDKKVCKKCLEEIKNEFEL